MYFFFLSVERNRERSRSRLRKSRSRSRYTYSSSNSRSASRSVSRSVSRSASRDRIGNVSPHSQAKKKEVNNANENSESREGEVSKGLDQSILGALGDRVIEEKKLGAAVHEDIALRWSDIVGVGIPEEERKKMLEKYPPPENCTLIDVPLLNPELKGKKEDAVLNRDKRIEGKQRKNTACLAAIAKGLTLLISQGEVIEKLFSNVEVDDPKYEMLVKIKKEQLEVIECFGNAGRLVADLQHDESMVRRSLILAAWPQMSDAMKETMKSLPIDKYLFGSDFMEKMKTAKQFEQTTESVVGKQKVQQKSVSKNVRYPPRGQYQASQGGSRHLLGTVHKNKPHAAHQSHRKRSRSRHRYSRNTHSRRR